MYCKVYIATFEKICAVSKSSAQWLCVRPSDCRSTRPGFEIIYCRFETLAISFTPRCLCFSRQTLKAVGPVQLVYMPGEVKYPTGKWKKHVVGSMRLTLLVISISKLATTPPPQVELFREYLIKHEASSEQETSCRWIYFRLLRISNIVIFIYRKNKDGLKGNKHCE